MRLKGATLDKNVVVEKLYAGPLFIPYLSLFTYPLGLKFVWYWLVCPNKFLCLTDNISTNRLNEGGY